MRFVSVLQNLDFTVIAKYDPVLVAPTPNMGARIGPTNTRHENLFARNGTQSN
jgi:hypothetical protein